MTSYRAPRRVAWVAEEAEDGHVTLYLMPLPAGEPVILRDLAAVIWDVAATEGDQVAARVRDLMSRPDAELNMIQDFLAELVEAGLLEVANDG